MTKSDELYAKHRELKNEVILELQKAIGKRTITLENSFEDEANNTIEVVDRENVYFDDISEYYPLDELSLLDAIYILSII